MHDSPVLSVPTIIVTLNVTYIQGYIISVYLYTFLISVICVDQTIAQPTAWLFGLPSA